MFTRNLFLKAFEQRLKMNKQLYELLHTQFQEYYNRVNVLNYIEAVKDSQNLNSEMVKQCLLQSSFWQINRSLYAYKRQIEYVWISNLEVNQKSMRLLKYFFQAYPKITHIYLWNNNLDTKALQELVKGLNTLKCIIFKENNIGKNMGEYLKVLNLNNIRSLGITSEYIGNKGIKNIMKMDWPSLEGMHLENVDLTTDFIKILTKIRYGIKYLELSGLNKVITTILVRNIVKSIPKCDFSLIRVTPFFDPNDGYYVGDLLKSSSIYTVINFAGHRKIYIRYPMNLKFQCPDKVKIVADPLIQVGWSQERN